MKKSIKVFHWIPRILCILAILFICMFALDSFAPGQTIWQQLGAFFIHLIPSFILLILLVVSWKWEYIGGIVFVVIGLGFGPIIFIHNYNINHSIWMNLTSILLVTFPLIVVGILFIVSHWQKRKSADTKNS
ncbi:MAG TPA: hypothetical protein PKX27_12310 [Bacteroidales bacterium]|nr:hypothetical protein [Bacteroidales bacterium]